MPCCLRNRARAGHCLSRARTTHVHGIVPVHNVMYMYVALPKGFGGSAGLKIVNESTTVQRMTVQYRYRYDCTTVSLSIQSYNQLSKTLEQLEQSK